MIEQIIINCFVCFGIYKAVSPGMILFPVKHYGDLWLPEWVRNPLYDCAICMASVWSLITAFYFGFHWNLILVIIATAGINYILTRLFPYTDR